MEKEERKKKKRGGKENKREGEYVEKGGGRSNE